MSCALIPGTHVPKGTWNIWPRILRWGGYLGLPCQALNGIRRVLLGGRQHIAVNSRRYGSRNKSDTRKEPRAKEQKPACSAGDPGLTLGPGRFPAEGIGYPLQYPGLENSMHCRVFGVAKSQTRLSNVHFHRLQKTRK